MKRAARFVAIAFFAFVVCSTLHAQSNPLVGTWELNTAKSKYDPGPMPKGLTRTVEAQGDRVENIRLQESPPTEELDRDTGFSVQFVDGKDNPVTGSMPAGADSISAKRTDSNHYVATLKKDGKVVGTSSSWPGFEGRKRLRRLTRPARPQAA